MIVGVFVCLFVCLVRSIGVISLLWGVIVRSLCVFECWMFLDTADLVAASVRVWFCACAVPIRAT
jgi:hypothetical protein